MSEHLLHLLESFVFGSLHFLAQLHYIAFRRHKLLHACTSSTCIAEMSNASLSNLVVAGPSKVASVFAFPSTVCFGRAALPCSLPFVTMPIQHNSVVHINQVCIPEISEFFQTHSR